MIKAISILMIMCVVFGLPFHFDSAFDFIGSSLSSVNDGINTVKGVVGMGVLNGPANIGSLLSRQYYISASGEYRTGKWWLEFKLKNTMNIVGEDNLSIVAVNPNYYLVTIRGFNDSNDWGLHTYEALRVTLLANGEEYDCLWIDPTETGYVGEKVLYRKDGIAYQIDTRLYEYRLDFYLQGIYDIDEIDNLNLLSGEPAFPKEIIVSGKFEDLMADWTSG